MDILRIGSRGTKVIELQKGLNERLKPSPKLVPDGIFGNLTLTAVRKFQADNWLVVDGEVGPCTFNAATGRETYAPILHFTSFIPQPTQTTCWAAATAMLRNSSVPIVVSQTPSDLILADGSLANVSEQTDWEPATRRYANAHRLRYVGPMSWGMDKLKTTLSRGPIAFDMLWNTGEYLANLGSSGHFIVVVGMRGDDTGPGTTLRIHDPWPPSTGKVYSVGLSKWLQTVPTRTYRSFFI
jgi:hypothetical protein